MSILSAIGNTALVELSNLNRKRPKVRILGKIEGCNPGGSVKDRPAYYMKKKQKSRVSTTGRKQSLSQPHNYEVGYIGKWHLASSGKGLNHVDLERSEDVEVNYQTKPIPSDRRGGYKDFWLASDVLEFTSHGYDGYLFDKDMRKVEFKGYRVDCLTDFALDYLRTRNRVKPFFLFLSYLEPHHQNDHNQYEGPEGSKERFGNFEPPGDLATLEGDWPYQFLNYLGCCASLDHNVGRIRKELEKLGMSDDTVIIYTSDHGCHFRTRNKDLEKDNYDDYKRSDKPESQF